MPAPALISFEVTAEQAQALLDALRQVAGEDHFKHRAEVRAFHAASDACRTALRAALEANMRHRPDKTHSDLGTPSVVIISAFAAASSPVLRRLFTAPNLSLPHRIETVQSSRRGLDSREIHMAQRAKIWLVSAAVLGCASAGIANLPLWTSLGGGLCLAFLSIWEQEKLRPRFVATGSTNMLSTAHLASIADSCLVAGAAWCLGAALRFALLLI